MGKPKSGAPWKRKQFNATYQGPMQVNATQRSLPTSTSTFTDGPSAQWNPANDLRSRNVDSWADTEPWELLDNAETPPATPKVQVLEDFAKPDHPRHRTLHWRACYTVHCPYHWEAMHEASYSPNRKRPVWLPVDRSAQKQPLN